MRTVAACSLGIGLALAGCKPGSSTNPVDSGTGPDAFVAPWWTPEPGEVGDWDIQLAGTPFDITAPRQMYALDLWAAVPSATTLDYGDGMPPLAVPAGAHADAIATLHARTPRPIVVCHVGMGAIRLSDPDAPKFPGFKAAPPNRPAVPDAGSVIGWSTPGGDGERFLDLGAAQRAIVKARVGKRIELAKQIGCDAIAAEYNDSFAFQTDPAVGTGFAAFTLDEYTSWATDVTGLAHARELSIGLRDRGRAPADAVATLYDWAIFDRCAEFLECDRPKPFLDRQKAVFALEYEFQQGTSDPNTIGALCNELSRTGINDEVIKNATLDSAFRMTCM